MGVPDCQLELWLLGAQNGYMYESDEKFLAIIPSDLRQRIAGQGHKMAGEPKLVAGHREELRADLAVLQEPSAFFKESGLLSGVACESIFSAPERLNCSTWWYRACVDAMAHDTSPARRKGRGTLRSGAAATAASPTAVVESAAATAAAQARFVADVYVNRTCGNLW